MTENEGACVRLKIHGLYRANVSQGLDPIVVTFPVEFCATPLKRANVKGNLLCGCAVAEFDIRAFDAEQTGGPSSNRAKTASTMSSDPRSIAQRVALIRFFVILEVDPVSQWLVFGRFCFLETR